MKCFFQAIMAFGGYGVYLQLLHPFIRNLVAFATKFRIKGGGEEAASVHLGLFQDA